MNKFMMKYLMITCKKATFLMAKKEEGKLSFTGRVKLSVHTSMCETCKRFERQILRIASESRHIHPEEELTGSANARISQLLKDHNL